MTLNDIDDKWDDITQMIKDGAIYALIGGLKWLVIGGAIIGLIILILSDYL